MTVYYENYAKNRTVILHYKKKTLEFIDKVIGRSKKKRKKKKKKKKKSLNS